MTANEFNENLKICKLSPREAKNKPCPFKTRKANSKFEGSAGQFRILFRIMVSALSDIIENSGVGRMIVSLQEVAEIITAPKLSVYEIESTMNDLRRYYLELRIEAIETLGLPRLRPKHHRLSHSSEFYIKYGPLIGNWSLRMESKHTYFKGIIRASKNFKNPPKTCATRHEMAQLCFRFHGLFPKRSIEIPPGAVAIDLHEDIEENSILSSAKEHFGEESLVVKEVKVFGTSYIPGTLIVLEKKDFGELDVGLVHRIIISNVKPIFYCSIYKAYQNKFNQYVATLKLHVGKWVHLKELQDYYPLTKIRTDNSSLFKFNLHHFVSESN